MNSKSEYISAEITLEDNVLVTKNGYDNLTAAIKGIQEMEKVINESEQC